jgi:hypothetical protein
MIYLDMTAPCLVVIIINHCHLKVATLRDLRQSKGYKSILVALIKLQQ